jgi:hypothetical protein
MLKDSPEITIRVEVSAGNGAVGSAPASIRRLTGWHDVPLDNYPLIKRVPVASVLATCIQLFLQVGLLFSSLQATPERLLDLAAIPLLMEIIFVRGYA